VIQVDRATMEMLETFSRKYAQIIELFEQGDEEGGAELCDEAYHHLRQRLVDEFLPLVDRLCKAGLIEAQVEGDDRTFEGNVAGSATNAFDNGVISVYVPEIAMWTPQSELDGENEAE
jgi:hypothetical protein